MDVEIILSEDNPKLGRRAQVVKVSPGYAYNYLIPNGLARLVTPAGLKAAKQEEIKRSRQEDQKKAEAAALAERIDKTSLTIEVLAGEDDKLFGAVTSVNILEALSAQGISIEKKDIQLEEPLHKLGAYQIAIKLHPTLSANLKLWVVKKKK